MSEMAVISRATANGNSGLAGAVLIIDDEAEIRESLQTLLELEGFAVETADGYCGRACAGPELACFCSPSSTSSTGADCASMDWM